MAFSYKEMMFASILIGNKDITLVSEKLWAEICAYALQYYIGFLFDLKAELYAFYRRTGKEQGTEDKKRSILIMKEKDESDNKVADTHQQGQYQPPQ